MMLTPSKLPNGNLLIPVRLEYIDGTITDEIVEVAPGSPEYEEWLPYVDDDE